MMVTLTEFYCSFKDYLCGLLPVRGKTQGQCFLHFRVSHFCTFNISESIVTLDLYTPKRLNCIDKAILQL